jgi:hypothetical protein
VFDVAAQMIRNDPELEAQCESVDSQKRIVHRKSGSFYRAISAEAYSKHGFNASIVWRKARLAAGCPGRIPHDFRRTAVRNLVRAGVPERVAMQLTGHKTRALFERYNIVSPGDLRDAARRPDAFALDRTDTAPKPRVSRDSGHARLRALIFLPAFFPHVVTRRRASSAEPPPITLTIDQE